MSQQQEAAKAEQIVVTNAAFGRQAVAQALAQLRQVRFSNGRTSYWVLRICKKYDSEFKKASAFYKELMDKHGVKEEQLGTPEAPADFVQADEAFQESTVEFGFDKLKVSELAEARLSAAQMEVLEPFLVFDFDAQEESNVIPFPQKGG